jgi:hypothetical protein
MAERYPKRREEKAALDEQELTYEDTDDEKEVNLPDQTDTDALLEDEKPVTDTLHLSTLTDISKNTDVTYSDQNPYRLPLRSGAEEADWFEQFRKRLTMSDLSGNPSDERPNEKDELTENDTGEEASPVDA